MPYIKQERRALLIPAADIAPKTAGELNFQFTQLALAYLRVRGLSYQTINDIVGALEGAKLEFYRRVAAPYEDTKIKENGDVYPG
jgi:hypothetical protein